jgi:cell shape-determining protein MreC
VQKSARVKKNDVLVTTGTHNARYPDLYPYGIQIGRVTSVGAADTAVYLQVQVQPFANLGALNSVSVLVPKKPHR